MALTTGARKAALRAHGDDPWLALITIEHAALTPPIRVALNNEDVVSNGETFQAFPFLVEAPEDAEGTPRGTLRIANVDRSIVDRIEDLDVPATLTMSMVIASEPDTLVRNFPEMTVRQVSGDIAALEASFDQEDVSDEPWPGPRLTAEAFPWVGRL